MNIVNKLLTTYEKVVDEKSFGLTRFYVRLVGQILYKGGIATQKQK